MKLENVLWGVAYGLLAIWLHQNSATVKKVTGPMGANGTPLLPF